MSSFKTPSIVELIEVHCDPVLKLGKIGVFL